MKLENIEKFFCFCSLNKKKLYESELAVLILLTINQVEPLPIVPFFKNKLK